MTLRVRLQRRPDTDGVEKGVRRAHVRKEPSGKTVAVRATTTKIDRKPTAPAAPKKPAPAKADPGRIYKLPLSKIEPDPEQHRKKFDRAELENLAQSMKEAGQLEPIIVTPIPGGRYRIVAGERRYRASKLNGAATIQAVVREKITPEERLAAQVIENIQRANVTPMEEAVAYRQLFDLWRSRARRTKKWQGKDMKDAAVAARFDDAARAWVASVTGKPGQHIAFYLRLTDLPEEVREMVQRGSLSPKHAYELTRVTDGVDDPAVLRERKLHAVRMARHAAAHSTPMPVLRQMVSQYIEQAAQGSLFGSEESGGGGDDKQRQRAEQKARFDRLLDSLADVVGSVWKEKDQRFDPRALAGGELLARAAKLRGAIKSLEDIEAVVTEELARRELGEATRRRTGENVGQTLFGVAKGIAARLRGRKRTPRTLCHCAEKGFHYARVSFAKAVAADVTANLDPHKHYSESELRGMGLRWITAHPHGEEGEGIPLIVRDLGDEYVVVGGAGHSLDMARFRKPKDGEGGRLKAKRREKAALPPEQQSSLESKLAEHKASVAKLREEYRAKAREVLTANGALGDMSAAQLDKIAAKARKKAEKQGASQEDSDAFAAKAAEEARRDHEERQQAAVAKIANHAMQQLAQTALTGDATPTETEVPDAEGRTKRIVIDEAQALDIARSMQGMEDAKAAERAVARALSSGRPPKAEVMEAVLRPLSDEEVRDRALEEHVDRERVRMNNALIDLAAGTSGKFSDRRLVDGAADAAYAVAAELTQSLPFTQEQMTQIGTRGAARLMARHLDRSGIDRKAAGAAVQKYMTEKGGAVAAEAVEQAEHLIGTADQLVSTATEGGMSTKAFAHARGLHYRASARQIATRAVGSLSMMAQLGLELDNPAGGELVLPGRDTAVGTKAAAQRMGLRKGDYEVKKGKRGYEIHVGAEAEDRLLKPRTLKSWAEDREIAAIRDGRAGDGWTMKAADGSEKPWKPEGMTDELPDGTKWELAPHQQADIKFLEQQHSVLISDEAGSGKTAAGLGAIAQLAKSGKARRWIVVVPKNTVTQWQEAAQAFLGPELAGAVEVASGDTERGKRGRMLRGEGAGDGPRIIITNHDTVRRHAGDIEEGKYDGMILDEAHYFTERQGADTAQRTEALHGLNTPYKMLMTGTPVKNDLSEFYSVVDYLQPGLLGDKAEFLQRYGKAGGSATAGHETLMRELQSEVRGVMMGTRLSRPSKGGGQELRPLGGGTGQQPVKMKETYVPVKPSASQKTGLRGVTDKFEEYRSLPGATLTRRDAEKKVINNGDAAQNAKVAAARKVLADHPGQRAILFATNVYTLDTIRAGLGLKDDEVAVLDGSMSDKQRFEVQRKLNDPKSPVRVVLATDAANTGQNLQGATVVVNVDLPDNPAIVRQRVARAWRLRPAGIRRDFPDLADTVSVYHLQSDTQYDIEQRERLRQKSKAVDLPSQMDMADDAGGIGGILQAYKQEVASHASASA